MTDEMAVAQRVRNVGISPSTSRWRSTPQPIPALARLANSSEDALLIATLAYMLATILVGFTVIILFGAGLGSIAFICALTIFALAASNRIDLACSLAVFAAMVSPLLTIICNSGLGSYPANLSLGILTAVCVFLAVAEDRYADVLAFAAILAVIALAALRAPSLHVGLYQAREVFVPVALVFCGLIAARNNQTFASVRWAILIVGLINLGYMVVEWAFGPVIPPIGAYEFKEFSRVHEVSGATPGLPGNYYFFYESGRASLVRLGGLLFNPPVTGIFTGLVAVLAFWTIRNRLLAGAFALIAVLGTVGTFSRAGMLLILVAIVLPLGARRYGPLLTGIGGLAALLLAAPFVQSQGSSSRHVEGLLASLNIALNHPLGAGFGHFGNSVKASASHVAGESLLGVLIAGSGVMGLALIGVAVYMLSRAIRRYGWPGWLGLGALSVAALSESAGGLGGTAGLWLITGLVVGLAFEARVVASAQPPKSGYARPLGSSGALRYRAGSKAHRSPARFAS